MEAHARRVSPLDWHHWRIPYPGRSVSHVLRSSTVGVLLVVRKCVPRARVPICRAVKGRDDGKTRVRRGDEGDDDGGGRTAPSVACARTHLRHLSHIAHRARVCNGGGRPPRQCATAAAAAVSFPGGSFPGSPARPLLSAARVGVCACADGSCCRPKWSRVLSPSCWLCC